MLFCEIYTPTKPPVARKQAVRHTGFVCLTASFQAIGAFFSISKCMQSLQACLFKYITVTAFCIYTQRGEAAANLVGLRPCIK